MKKFLSVLLSFALIFGGLAHAAGQAAQDWVIFVYITGTDLESKSGAATADLEEMIDGNSGQNIRFVVQTGGTEQWEWPDFIPSDRIGRYEIYDNRAFALYDGELQNMGEAQTLRGFVSWGFEQYQAEKYGLILWDHGSGSINGGRKDAGTVLLS